KPWTTWRREIRESLSTSSAKNSVRRTGSPHDLLRLDFAAGPPGRSADFRLAGRSVRAGCPELVREFRDLGLRPQQESLPRRNRPGERPLRTRGFGTFFSERDKAGFTELSSRSLRARCESFGSGDPESHRSAVKIWNSRRT